MKLVQRYDEKLLIPRKLLDSCWSCCDSSCDLLKISAANLKIFQINTKLFKRYLYFCGKITKKR